MKKITLLLFFMVAALFVFGSTKEIKAQGETIKLIEGASIRTTTENVEQGLRFYAELLDENVDEHGFYIIYGEATVADLEQALSKSGELTINDKKVFKKAITGFDENKRFSVVLTGIPEIGYAQKITVIAYTIKGEIETYTNASVTRSVLEVALKMDALDEGNEVTEDILEYANANVKLVKYENGKIIITNDFNDKNPESLKKLFLRDWNKQFGTNLTMMDASFASSAKAGIPDATDGANKILSNGNLYKFFKNPANATWRWMLDYFIVVGAGTTHPKKQAEAIKGDGTFGVDLLYRADHLIYSINNFFNREYKTNFSASTVNFTSQVPYNELNNPKYKVIGSTNFYHMGESFVFDLVAEEKDGYNFIEFSDGTNIYELNDVITITDNVTINPIYEAIEYTLTFMIDDEEVGELGRGFTVEDVVMLPNVLDGITVEWYLDSDLSGENVSTISGHIGDLILFGKLGEEAPGGVKFNSIDEMKTAFLTDLHTYSNSTDPLMTFIHGEGKTAGYNGTWVTLIQTEPYTLYALNSKEENSEKPYFINQPEYNEKWLPLFNYVDSIIKERVSTESLWGSPFTGVRRINLYFIRTTFNQTQLDGWPEEYQK